jgi:hypothetical protein
MGFFRCVPLEDRVSIDLYLCCKGIASQMAIDLGLHTSSRDNDSDVDRRFSSREERIRCFWG